jgi:hypothetical protein
VRRRRWPRLRKKKKKKKKIVVLDKAIAELKRMLRLRLRGLRPEGQHRINYTAVLDFMRAQRVVLGGARRKPIIKKFTAIEMASFNPPSRKDIALFEVMISGHSFRVQRRIIQDEKSWIKEVPKIEFNADMFQLCLATWIYEENTSFRCDTYRKPF